MDHDTHNAFDNHDLHNSFDTFKPRERVPTSLPLSLILTAGSRFPGRSTCRRPKRTGACNSLAGSCPLVPTSDIFNGGKIRQTVILTANTQRGKEQTQNRRTTSTRDTRRYTRSKGGRPHCGFVVNDVTLNENTGKNNCHYGLTAFAHSCFTSTRRSGH